MKARVSVHLSYANAMATVAVFVALGGTSYAAISISGKNIKNGSVTGADLKNGSITGADVRNGSLTGNDVRAHSLTGRDIKSGSLTGQLPVGPRGATGASGATGAMGARGAAGATNVVVRSTNRSCPANACAGFTSGVVSCAAGERATGGGAALVGSDGVPHPVMTDNLAFSGPADATGKLITSGTPTAWLSVIQEGNSTQARFENHYVICAQP